MVQLITEKQVNVIFLLSTKMVMRKKFALQV